jgi:hypothetical protein
MESYVKGKRLGINIRPDIAEKLLQLQGELHAKLGVKLSLSGVVEYLVTQHTHKEGEVK